MNISKSLGDPVLMVILGTANWATPREIGKFGPFSPVFNRSELGQYRTYWSKNNVIVKRDDVSFSVCSSFFGERCTYSSLFNLPGYVKQRKPAFLESSGFLLLSPCSGFLI